MSDDSVTVLVWAYPYTSKIMWAVSTFPWFNLLFFHCSYQVKCIQWCFHVSTWCFYSLCGFDGLCMPSRMHLLLSFCHILMQSVLQPGKSACLFHWVHVFISFGIFFFISFWVFMSQSCPNFSLKSHLEIQIFLGKRFLYLFKMSFQLYLVFFTYMRLTISSVFLTMLFINFKISQYWQWCFSVRN